MNNTPQNDISAGMEHMEQKILLVDDDQRVLNSMETALLFNGIENVTCCNDSRQVSALLKKQNFAAVVLDLSMPHLSGEELLDIIVRDHPHTPVIIVTGINEAERAVHCIKTGAMDYIVKPVDEARLLTSIRHGIELHELRRENANLQQRFNSDELDHPEAFDHIKTCSPRMRRVFQHVEAIAGTSQPVLITGETGTGKELVAHAIHNLSRRAGMFVTVNAAGLDEHMFTDTLFGHRKGAFTNAVESRKGLVAQAEHGTLFLDEIGDLCIAAQVKLLRLLQEHEYFPLGEDMPRHTDARIIVATHHDLSTLQKTGKFRNDLYYRLCRHHVHIPPLRERLNDDLPVLTNHFLRQTTENLRCSTPKLAPDTFQKLQKYNFPGNVRELESMIFDAVSRHRGGMLQISIPAGNNVTAQPDTVTPPQFPERNNQLQFPLKLPSLKLMSIQLIREALRRTNGNQAMAAGMLGISQQALNQRLHRLQHQGIELI